MREPDLSELSPAELLLGLSTAAVAYFAPPLLLITLPALGVVLVRRVAPGTGDGAVRLLADSGRAVREYVTTGTLPQFALARRQPAQEPRQEGRPSEKAPPVAEGAPLRPAAWLKTLNDEPDRAPHSLIIGPSGAGKTTLAAAVLGKRQGSTVVLSPKVNAGNWRGAEVVSLDDDGGYEPLAAALGALEHEKRRRIRVLRQEGAQALTPLTVVLDETPELVRFVPDTGGFISSMSSIGRELSMRMVVLSTSERVGALGIKGRGDTLSNFVRVDLDRDRNAVLRDGIGVMPLDLGNVYEGAQRAQLRPWRDVATPPARPVTATTQNLQPRPAPADVPLPANVIRLADRRAALAQRPAAPDPQVSDDALDLLSMMLAAPVSSASQSLDTGRGVSVSASTAPDTDTDTGGVSSTTTTLVTGGEGPALRIDVHARAEAAPQTERPRHDPHGRRRSGLDARRRRLLAEQRKVEQRKAELRTAYEQRKAAGLSYRKAYAELGGASEEARAWWAAAPAPAKEIPNAN